MPTYPAARPGGAIDHLLFRPEVRFRVVERSVLEADRVAT